MTLRNQSTQPLLSIAVAAYNVSKYLRRGLDSYADERLNGRLEVIIVDDGSTDDTAAIARSYVDEHPDIFILVRKENGGHGSSVNAGLAAAHGKYFRIIDGDDWVDTDALALFLDVLENIDTDLVIDVKREVHLDTGAEKLFPIPEDLPLNTPIAFESICTRDEFADFVMIHSLTVRTELLRAQGVTLLEHTFYVDYEYVTKAALHAMSVCFVDLNVYQYLVGNAEQSVADANYVKHWDDHERVTIELMCLYGEHSHELSEPRRAFLFRKAMLVINTHYSIALIFDDNRRRGRQRARAFRKVLEERYPELDAATKGRYRKAFALHLAGVDSQQKLDRLVGR